MAKVMVQCRICGEKFNRLDPTLVEGEYFVKPSKNMYYHKICYDDYQKNKLDVHAKKEDGFWYEATKDYLQRDLKGDIDWQKFGSQWKNFLKKKMTAKGIYFALRYFYGIKRNDFSRSENGIGIVPHIYEDSCNYWRDREEKDRGICEAIERQIIEASKQEKVVVNIAHTKKKKISAAEALAALEDESEEE